jgi:hypothetical protein
MPREKMLTDLYPPGYSEGDDLDKNGKIDKMEE